jgi:hypothetical protein
MLWSGLSNDPVGEQDPLIENLERSSSQSEVSRAATLLRNIKKLQQF